MYKLKKNRSKRRHDDPDFIMKDEALREVGEGRKKITKEGEKQIVITMGKNKDKNKKEEIPVDQGKLPPEPTFKIR
ncbi:MAG: hypothetical protein C4581_06645 [Nitrospiraceae bacterium]|nr:MAG: hypothetical protein C4581_06645 [Nitrospiraceae bacterium]